MHRNRNVLSYLLGSKQILPSVSFQELQIATQILKMICRQVRKETTWQLNNNNKEGIRFPRWFSVCQYRRCKRCGFDPWVENISWRRARQPTPGFLPGESHGQRSLAGYSPWSPKSQKWLKRLSTHTERILLFFFLCLFKIEVKVDLQCCIGFWCLAKFSFIYMCVYLDKFFCIFFSIVDYYKILNIVPYIIQ